MRRKSLLVIGILFLVGSGILAGLIGLVVYEPAYYRERETEPGEVRSRNSKVFSQTLSRLYGEIMADRPSWQATFTEAQINSYLADKFVTSHLDKILLPEGVSDPRIAIDREVIHLGFRYGTPPWSTIMSVDLRVWMAPGESNVVLLQVLGIRAGALPISSKMLIEKAAEAVRNQYRDLEITWHRHEGRMTALLRFNSSRQRTQLQKLQVGQGMLQIAGRTPPETPYQSCPQAAN
jgi:hypothetical protein